MKFIHETEYEEFKESTAQVNRAMESLAAMLNKNGKGKVYFGIKDDGEICGVALGSKTITEISRAVAEQIKPVVLPKILCDDYDGKTVIAVEVEGENKPYSARGEYRIRSGDENRKIEPEQLKDLVFRNSVELIGDMESIDQDLGFSQLKSLYMMNGLTIDDATFEKNAGLLTRNGKYNCLAEILADSNNCSIKVVRFSGRDKQDMIVRNEYGYKCMLLAMRQAYDYVSTFNETRVNVGEDLKRKETPRFDIKCFNEAWSNACLHNRWVKNIPPAIYIFENRIEIVSTGGLPVDYSEEEFFAGISHPVNLRLQKIMGQLDLVEQTGHGVPKIVAKYGKEAFELAENHITVTIPFEFSLQGQSKTDGLTLPQKELINQMINHPTAKISDYATMMNLSTARINQLISDLKKLGRIKRNGGNKSGYWEIL